ncbi:MAG TPA: serine/threonine-protein kinase [Kofleriaceae bacterium]|nr:serine/threonine-protein kinase [Kofleriaceae bacterium]
MHCGSCGAAVLDIDVKCPKCGHNLASTGAHRLLGTTVLSVYELVDVLGQGGMSVVYKGRHKMTEQEVALKILPPELAAHAQVKSRFLDEAKALAQLDHPNIVHLYNFGQENGCFVLAMQYVSGRTWERMILEAERLDWIVSVRITIDVLRALEYAHGRGVVHRDMKPSNVLVRDDDGSATVMDFGIAKMTTSTRLTATGQTMGTVRYMSPEQVRGQEVDLRTDIYSLGATLYESLVGDTPFDGNTHFEIMTKHLNEAPKPPSVRGIPIPIALETALMRSLAKKPDDRFQTAREFRKELELAVKDADVGKAETLRMSRDAVAQARTHSGGQQRSQAVTAPEPKDKPEVAEVRAESIADALEPAASTTRARRSKTPWLLIGLGGAVVVAGAVVAVMMLGGGTSHAKKKPPPEGSAGSAAHGPFLPPEITWAAQQTFADRGLDVRCAGSCDTDDIARDVDDAFARFRAFAAKRKAGETVAAQPLTLLVIPARVLCDARVYETGHAPDNCAQESYYYRPLERTLLVVDDTAHLRANLSAALAEAICVHQPNLAACEAIDLFAKESAGSSH